MTVTVSVCIATHKRPDGLRRLLESLVRQESAPPFEIVVVDNDAAGSARAVVGEFERTLPIAYLIEPKRGLARVRNRAVQATTGAFIAFIDDDEEATPTWLGSLAQLAEQTGADAAIGPVTIIFEDGVPEFIRNCRLFSAAPVADGQPLPWFRTRTSNAYVARRALPDGSAPFMTKFDLTGGEDVDLFKRMADAGALIVGARNALVFEHRAKARANLRWVVRRAIRNGSTIAAVAGHPGQHASHGVLSTVRARLRQRVRTCRKGCEAAWRASMLWRRDRAEAMQSLITACEEVGKLIHSFGLRVEEYRNHP